MKNSIILASFIFFIFLLFYSSTSAREGHVYGHGYYGNFYFGHNHFRPHQHLGLHFGYPLINYSYIHTPTITIVKEIEAPVTYIEKQPKPREEPLKAANYWYYCKKPAAYYPEVESCPGGWVQLVPRKIPN
ncbi:MAG: hypothetical protein QM479_09880 [Pseudomonadota bacterium]